MLYYGDMLRKEFLGPEEWTVQQLRGRFDRWGVKNVGMDLDSTLIDTTGTFCVAMLDASKILLSDKIAANVSEELREPQGLKELFMDKVVWGLRPEFGVNPAVMPMTVFLTARRLGLNLSSLQVEQAIARLEQIYTDDTPPLFEGALEAVELINATGVRLLLMTHADEDWAWRKIIGAGLVGKFERIVCFKIDRPKSKQWQAELKRCEIQPQDFLSIGDNLKTDILPVVELGGRGIWVTGQSKKIDNGEANYENTLDEMINRQRVIEVKKIGKVIEAILRW